MRQAADFQAASATLYLQVAVHHVLRVQVGHSRHCLREELESLSLAEGSLRVLVVEKVALLSELHHHVDPVVSRDRLPEFDDVRVIQFGVQLDFAVDQFEFGGGEGVQVDLGGAGLTILRAYMRQVLAWRASLTVPKDPQPIFLSSIIWNSSMEANLFFETIFSILSRFKL
jgi:hypothetical protein